MMINTVRKAARAKKVTTPTTGNRMLGDAGAEMAEREGGEGWRRKWGDLGEDMRDGTAVMHTHTHTHIHTVHTHTVHTHARTHVHTHTHTHTHRNMHRNNACY